MPLRLWVGVGLGLALLPLVSCAGARTPRLSLERARRQLDGGQARAALSEYDAIAARPQLADEDRLSALVGGAHACDRLNDPEGARARLESAIERDLPGKIEVVEFELAERLRDRDRAHALSLYYRAASGAEKFLGGNFPYRAAMDRIVQLSMDH